MFTKIVKLLAIMLFQYCEIACFEEWFIGWVFVSFIQLNAKEFYCSKKWSFSICYHSFSSAAIVHSISTAFV